MSGSLRLSVLIPLGENVAQLAQPIEQARRSGAPGPEIIVPHHPSISETVLARLQMAWPSPGVRYVAAEGESPGALRNAGVAAASGDLVMFLEAGDRVDPRYAGEASRRLALQSNLAFVTAWARRPGACGLETLLKPGLTLAAILGESDPIPAPTVVRRRAWEAVGGFDEDLPSCEWYEFWLRLLATGVTGDVIEEPLIGYEASRQSALRRRLDPEHCEAGMRRVIEKHLSLFQRHVVTALCDRETALRGLYEHYHRLLRLRDSLVSERTTLQQEAERTASRLEEMGAPSFDWGDLRRLLPVSPDWGYERGTPIDRYYIERFLESHAADVQGTVLEVQEPDYTRRFGRDRVTRSDVIDIDAANARANLTGDLRRLDGIPSDTYDCFILTQTIHVIDDMRAVLRQAMRVLKPGGALLVTLPCASRVCLEYGRDGDFWRVTEAGARQLFSEIFPSSHLEIQSFGNVLTNVAFLEGLACHEISNEEFEVYDPFHPLLIGIRAVKPVAAPEVLCRRNGQGSAAILLYHRVGEPALDVHGLSVRTADFRAQMAHLARAYQPMPLPRLLAAAREGWLPERAVAVTFDDGYIDNLEVASPILLERQIPATFFITSIGILGGQEFWWDVLGAVFFGPAPLPERLELEWQGEVLALPTATAEERQQAHWALYHRVRQAGPEDRDDLMQRVKQWAAVELVDAGSRPMNRAELEDLARRPGHSIGGHGAHHLSFSVHSREVVRGDVRANKSLLEAAIGRAVTSFAYPFGDHDDASVAEVQTLGYRAAVTCVAGLVRNGAHPMRLPRVEVKSEPARSFEEWLDGFFDEGGRGSL